MTHINDWEYSANIMHYHKLLLPFLLVIASCSSSTEPYVDPDLVSPAPISEIQERYNGSPEDALVMLSSVLESEGFSVPTGANFAEGFETGSLSVQDKLCNSTYASDTPLACRVRFFVKINPESNQGSRIILRYKETCLDQEHINVSCKDSKGEKLLFKVHRSLSAGS